jgi:hypothetical protein
MWWRFWKPKKNSEWWIEWVHIAIAALILWALFAASMWLGYELQNSSLWP